MISSILLFMASNRASLKCLNFPISSKITWFEGIGGLFGVEGVPTDADLDLRNVSAITSVTDLVLLAAGVADFLLRNRIGSGTESTSLDWSLASISTSDS